MKRILILIFLIPVLAFGQVDSTKMFVKNVAFQARDLELLTSKRFLSGGEIYEDWYQLAQSKFTGANPPANLTSVTIDSIRIDALIDLSQWMRVTDYGLVANFFGRVDAVIKAIPNAFLQRTIADIDAGYMQQIISDRMEGRRRLRKIRQ